MMRRTLPCLPALLALLAAAPAAAEKADRNKPTEVQAARMWFDDVKQINSFSGNVHLTRGSLQMKAERMTLNQDAAGFQFLELHGGAGKTASYRQKREGLDQWVEGAADRIEYDSKSELVKFHTRARVRRLQGNQVLEEISGATIVYDSVRETFQVQNGPATAGQDNRITTVIQPRKPDQDTK
ncbi:lipopolysaccharide transport periplasmic protein LptA [Massilia sp. W12]|uniref:lipopolysaccharide transport periplasmic protein LptA n=1 Tax=Massilia sp. W12 TaxID=3126507 RepID=UPI0030CD452D